MLSLLCQFVSARKHGAFHKACEYNSIHGKEHQNPKLGANRKPFLEINGNQLRPCRALPLKEKLLVLERP